MEKIYKVMRNAGGASIAMGVVLKKRRFDILGRREYACKGNDQEQMGSCVVFCALYSSPFLFAVLF